MFAASLKSPVVDFPGIPNYLPTESSESLQELARLNKEIEDVKSEVEEEQRRLSLYKTELVGRGNAASATLQRTHNQTTCKYVNGDGDKPSSHRRTPKLSSQALKYVVDNSKPRTDLEYDPLSNFSADLRSYSSSGKDQKDKAGVKRANEVSCSDRHKLQSASREVCPVLEDDVLQEGDLVIDIPSSPELKKRKVHDVTENQSAVAEEDQNSPHMEADGAASQETAHGEASSVTLTEPDQSSQSRPLDMFDGLSKCLEDLRSENQRICGSHVEHSGEESSWDGEVKGRPEDAMSFQDHFQDVRHTVEFNGISVTTAPSPASAVETTEPVQVNREPRPAPSPLPRLRDQTAGPPAPTHTAPHYWSAATSLPTVVPCGQASAPPPPSGADVRSHFPSPQTSPPTEFPPGRASPAGGGNVILIESSSGESAAENLNYWDVDLSDSDPMEECYRIFMEANEAETRAPDPPTGNGEERAEVEMSAVEEKPQALSAQKRVAHLPRHPEPLAMVRHHPKVLQVQQRAPALTASASSHQRRPETGAPVSQNQVQHPSQNQVQHPSQNQVQHPSQNQLQHPSQNQLQHPSQNQLQHQVSLQNAYMSCIQVGNNLHFLLPDGSFPLPGSSGSVLTPISSVTAGGSMPSFQLSTVTPVQRYRLDPPGPVHMVGHMSLLPSVSALGHTGAAAPAGPQGALRVPPKPLTKRKVKQRSERVKDKVPHDVRQRYVNMFTEEFLKTSPTVKDSFEKALAEERTVYNRSANKLKYLSVAVNALKRLKNHSAAPTKDENEMSGKRAKGNIPLNVSQLVGSADAALYDSLKEYIMNEEKLVEQNYPLQNPERPGSAVLFADNKKSINDPLKRICCRCGATYSVSTAGKHTRKDECNYHYGKGVEKKVPGGVETRYSCCEGVMGAPGCQVFRLHVHDAVDMDGFVSSRPRDSWSSCPGVFSLDCEMCYTTHGLEPSRVTVVNSALQVVYDAFVRPDNEVVDFNTRFSGISEKDVTEDCPSVGEVQQTLLQFISADTILVGHGLETSLCALKFLHGTVVDTSVVFPHRMGPPHKMTLNNLTADYLRRIIQDSVCGHDTADDASACMELLLWKVKEDGRGRKW